MINGVASIDVHTHVATPRADALTADHPDQLAEQQRDARWFGQAAGEVNREQLHRVGPLLTDIDLRLQAMDQARVDVHVVAPMPFSRPWTDRSLAEQAVNTTNEGVAAFVGARPDRLIGVGTVALHHPELAVQQLDTCVGALGLRGVQIGTRAGELELDHPALQNFWARAEELQAIVLIHPWGCTLGERLADYYLGNTVGNPVETTVALSRIIFSGLLDRHPTLKLCSVHGGGYLPTYLGRSDHAWSVRPDAHLCQQRPSSYLKRIWFDSLLYSPTGLRALVDAVGAGQVLLGSDYPFDMGVTDPVDRLEAAGLDPDTVTAIAGGNAAHLGLSITSHQPPPAPPGVSP